MPSKSVVLDSSAVLAWLLREPGHQRIQDALEEGLCHMSSVNLAEVVTRGSRVSAERALAMVEFIHAMGVNVQAYDEAQALQSGLLEPFTRKKGLSLGDRACLALARELKAEVLTADSAWLELDLDIPITHIRPEG